MQFTLQAQDSGSKARAGLIKTAHGEIRTPIFMPVGTVGSVKAVQVTDSNGAFFDVAHTFAGCIPGVHEVLYRQGLIPGIWCLNPRECLSQGQMEEIDRVYREYPELNDDDFARSCL